MEIKRSLTNLTVNSALQLPRNELKKKFLCVFNHGFKYDPYVFMNRLMASSLWPELANNPAFGKDKKTIQRDLKQSDPATFAPFIRLSKELGDQPFFRVSIPLRSRTIGNGSDLAGQLKQNFLDGVEIPVHEYAQVDDELVQNTNSSAVLNRFVPAQKILTNASWLETSTKMELAETLIGIRFETKGHQCVVFADFKISVAEAQQLSSTPWMRIRTIDLYPLILHWVINAYGYRGRPLISSFPISSIAKTLPADHAKPDNLRIDSFGLSISPDGRPMYLPRELDNTARYEDLYTQAGVNDDNSFSLLDQHKAGEVPRLPLNIPVLIDWQNLKFAYSNTSGVLTTLDLGRFQRVNAAHAMALLGKSLPDDKLINQLINLAQATKTPLTLAPYYNDDLKDVGNGVARDEVRATTIDRYWLDAVRLYRKYEGQDIILMSDLTESNPFFAPFARFFAKLYSDCMTNLDVVYLRYSVSYTTQLLGTLGIIVEYGGKLTDTKLADETMRSAATSQEVTEGWEPPAIPLLSDRVGMLPHQKKCRNLLKDSPDFAILPVQAGGGKSMLAITDILYEIKANHNEPYLILCPGHLVAQYVKEIVFFTAGKLNAIPVTTYVLRTSGYARLSKIMEAAPRNTVVVCDYDALRYRAANTIYGTSPTAVFPVIEFLRQFGFKYCLLDESHLVKNPTARTRACMALIADIPKKRLASGTMAHDSPSDLALQISMLDPTLFGTRAEFNDTYGEVVHGDRVAQWKPGAAGQIMAKIKSRVVVAGAMRKEWAALLPIPQEKFLRVDLSSAQLAVYQSVLEATLETIREKAKTDKNLAAFLDPSARKPEDNAESEEEFSESLEGLLKPYLARLEQFLTAPARDPLGDKLLTGEDRISPKVRMIAERIRLHQQSGVAGKVLIFTNYTAGAEEIFNNMPDDLKNSGILYTASEKIEKGAEFETSAKKTWMVGVEFSMNTGLNFQHVSRLIRVDTVWNPGTLEQGNSRVNRPELKKAERRESIFFDWIVSNNCVVGTTLVPTELGLCRIGNLGDSTGKQRQPLTLTVGSRTDPQKSLSWWNNGKAPTLKVSTYGGRDVQGTRNHGLLVLRNGKHVWVHLEDIVLGDYTCVNLEKLVRTTPLELNLDLPVYTNERHDHKRRDVVYQHILTSDIVSTKSIENVSNYTNWQCIKFVKTLLKKGALRLVTAKSGNRPATYTKTNLFSDKVLSFKDTSSVEVTSLPSQMNTSLAYALGLFVAEGMACRGTILGVGMQNREPIEAFSAAMEQNFGLRKPVKTKKLDPDRPKAIGQVVYEDAMYSSRFQSAGLVNVFDQLGCYVGDKINDRRQSWDKCVPWSILEADEESQLAFLAGFWEGDGTQNKGEMKFCTVSEDIRQQIQAIVTTHGFRMNRSMVSSMDAPALWQRMLPYIKGPKRFRPLSLVGDRTKHGVPAKFWTDLLKDRYRGKYRVGRDGGDFWRFESDTGNLVEATFDTIHQKGNKLTSVKYFRYEQYRAGRYDLTLTLLEKISPEAYADLVVALESGYYYDKVVSKVNGGIRNVYDISVSNGKDSKEPSYVVNGLVGHNTIDVTKISRLISKIVSIAKFENSEDGNYQGLPDVPVIGMTLENVLGLNSWDTNLLEYFTAYRDYKGVQSADYAEYRAKHGDMKLEPIESAPTPSDAMLLKRVPYVPGLELYGQADLGLVRVDEYLRLDTSDEDEEDQDNGVEDQEVGDSVNPLAVALVGRSVHTEYGDGIVTHVGKNLRWIWLRLPNNIETRVRPAAAFLITRQETSTKDIRNQILKEVGALPIATPIDVPATGFRAVKITKKEMRMKEREDAQKQKLKPSLFKPEPQVKATTVEIDFSISNGFLSLSYLGETESDAAKALEAIGFRPNHPFIYAQVINAQRLVKQFNVWEAAGFTLDKSMAQDLSTAFRSMHKMLTTNSIAKHRAVYKFSQSAKLKNFYRMEAKPNNDPLVIKPYPMIEDGMAYIVLPVRGQSGTKSAVQHKAPGIKWKHSAPSLSYFCPTMVKAVEVIKTIQASGVEIANLPDLKKEFNKIKKAAFRTDDDLSDMEV